MIAQPIATGTKSVAFDLAERPAALPCFNGKTLPLWTFQEGTLFPIVRMKLGQCLEARFKNDLPRPGEHASIHWHGLRIPNSQDGVPYMTQQPIDPGQEGSYDFTPPDTGTFFFHTHCNSAEHFGRGLVGALIVEGDEIVPPDAEYVLMMKDWRVSPEGTFLPFSSDEGAAKAGTAGTIRSINGVTKPVIKVPSSANVRIRFYNVDPVRISEIGFEGGEAAIIAVDGNGLKPLPLEFVANGTGHASRHPAAYSARRRHGAADGFLFQRSRSCWRSSNPKVLRSGAASSWQRPSKSMPYKKFNVRDGRAHPVRILGDGHRRRASLPLSSEFSGIQIGSLCLANRTFWAINKQAWPAMDHRNLGPPLAVLKSGQSYIFELKNLTPHVASDPYPRPHVRGIELESAPSAAVSRRYRAAASERAYRGRPRRRRAWENGCSTATSSSIRKPA